MDDPYALQKERKGEREREMREAKVQGGLGSLAGTHYQLYRTGETTPTFEDPKASSTAQTRKGAPRTHPRWKPGKEERERENRDCIWLKLLAALAKRRETMERRYGVLNKVRKHLAAGSRHS